MGLEEEKHRQHQPGLDRGVGEQVTVGQKPGHDRIRLPDPEPKAPPGGCQIGGLAERQQQEPESQVFPPFFVGRAGPALKTGEV